LSKNTVQRYLDLLEKAFIIKKLGLFREISGAKLARARNIISGTWA
jgi:predicted AAA+ superfamily ATPase